MFEITNAATLIGFVVVTLVFKLDGYILQCVYIFEPNIQKDTFKLDWIHGLLLK